MRIRIYENWLHFQQNSKPMNLFFTLKLYFIKASSFLEKLQIYNFTF